MTGIGYSSQEHKMDTNEIKIRPATEADAAEILNIYAPYITDTAITFEYGHKQRFNRRGHQVPLYQRSHHKQGMVKG